MKRKALLITVIFTAAALAAGLTLTGEAAAFYHKKSGSDSGMVEAEITFTAPDAMTAGRVVIFKMVVAEKMKGRMLKHSNGVIKITTGEEVIKEKAFHTHTGDFSYGHTFHQGGAYMLSVTFFPHPELAPVRYGPVTIEKTVEVKEDTSSQPSY